ncbi:carbonate dehydratase [Cupriavidus sp. L7L]|uniref:carbonate dehydratase n=1 Tax=Cupriavidus sp. L7L TaxID=2546443 RepID=UPI0010541C60|nr:carbonate dehydratase [Cupriavidus sp. L7L]TDF63185.1 carbonate dehydratase [Cupriavidus sp. L7L]
MATNYSLDVLLENNRRWSTETNSSKPGFFLSLTNQQSPQCLWIGCADSRVPANELVGLQPGELFVHRNIANVVAHSDLNCLSVLQYAIDVLEVKHVIVVGHSNCGGVRAALENKRVGIADNWVRHVRDVVDKHSAWLSRLPNDLKLDAACALNAIEQARNVALTTVVQDAWSKGRSVQVHGLAYSLHNGLLTPLGLSVGSTHELSYLYPEAVRTLPDKLSGHAAPFYFMQS